MEASRPLLTDAVGKCDNCANDNGKAHKQLRREDHNDIVLHRLLLRNSPSSSQAIWLQSEILQGRMSLPMGKHEKGSQGEAKRLG